MVTYGRYLYRDGRWLITAEPHVIMRLRRIFPRTVLESDGALAVKATPEVAADIEWVLQRWPLDADPFDTERLTVDAGRHRQTAAQIDRVMSGDRADIDQSALGAPRRPPRWPHQASNADLITLSRRLLITDGLGAGKTWSGCSTFRNPGALPAVVVVQSHLARQWREQIALDWPDLCVHEIARRRFYNPEQVELRPVDVYLCTYSKLDDWAPFFADTCRTVIFDEAQELRHGQQTAKGTAAKIVADRADYALGLTNTPMHNYGGEIHNLFEILRPDLLGTRPEFLREWCGTAGDGGKPMVSNPRALGTYLRDLGVMVGHTLAEEPPLHIPFLVDSDAKAFDAAAGDAAELARFILSTEGTPFERMQASGELDLRLRQATGIAKAGFVAEFVKMLLDQVDRLVLFGWHRAVYDIWMEALAPFSPRLYTGSETAAGKDASARAFVDDRDPCRVLVVSLRSGAGLDGLQAVSNTAVFGELDWSPSVHKQAIGRLDRPGQENRPVLAYFAHSTEGSDPPMLELLGLKASQTEPIVNPDVERLTPVSEADRVRMLAEAVLKARR